MITHKELLERLDYKGGVLYWKNNPERLDRWNNRYAGQVAGHYRKDGYYIVNIDKKLYLAHRVIWLYVTGEWPEKDIDHIDGNPSNNVFENFRLVTSSENHKNSKLYSRNKTGVPGCYWDKARNRFVVDIRSENKRTRVRVKTIEEAQSVRSIWEDHLGFHVNHGRTNTFKLEETGG